MVTLDVNGGTVDGKATEEVIAIYDTAFVIPDAVCEGYTFDRWYTSDGARFVSGSVWKTVSDAILTAHWSSAGPYKVIFDLCGGILVGDKTAEVDLGSEFGITQYTERLGYISVDWFTADGKQIVSGDVRDTAEDAVFYAH